MCEGSPGVNPTKLFSSLNEHFFPFFDFKLGHFKAQTIFYYASNTQAYQWKLEKRRNKSLVGLTPGVNPTKLFSSQNGDFFRFFAIVNTHFIVSALFSNVTKPS